VIVAGVADNVKSGGKLIVVRSLAASFATFSSPPPETVALFVTFGGAFVATLAVTVMVG